MVSEAGKEFSREQFQTPAGRRRAWRNLILTDHGILRSFYDNTHAVVEGRMWRTYQPGPKRLYRWKQKGIKTVINLRGSKPSGFLRLEEEACEKLGLHLETFRAYSRDAPSIEILHSARALFERIEYPAIMHCKSGADRAGLMSALYLFYQEGTALDEALQQLSLRYGHVRHGKTGVIDYAFQLYLSYANENRIALNDCDAFLDWVDTRYDPVKTKNDFQSTWWGTLLTERILRRE
ncbi:MAG: protein tyrosine phosphatase [Pseudomonadota bacterium]